MKRKIFSKLLMVALVIAAVGSFVSCKDYDDDINNLQKQIDAKAAISELTALQSTLDSKIAAAQSAAQAAQATADAAATKTAVADLKTALEAAIADAKKAGTDAGTQAGNAITAANKAQETADGAAAAAKKADEDAKAALADALKTISETYATKAEAAAASTAAADAATAAAKANAAIEKLGETYFTIAEAEKLQKQVNDLKADLEAAIDEKIDAKIKEVNNAVASVDAIWGAVTSVELVPSSNSSIGALTIDELYFLKGTEVNNAFGAAVAPAGNAAKPYDGNTIAEIKNYKAGDPVKFDNRIVIRVNPANAAFTADDVVLINSKGESLNDLLSVDVEPYTQLITRGDYNTGLYVVSFTRKGDVTEDDFYKAVSSTNGKYDAEENPLCIGKTLYAIGINNSKDAAEARYVNTTFDLGINYGDYVRQDAFSFTVTDKANEHNIADLHNRWDGNQLIGEDQTKEFPVAGKWNAELVWAQPSNDNKAAYANHVDTLSVSGQTEAKYRNWTVTGDARYAKKTYAVLDKDQRTFTIEIDKLNFYGTNLNLVQWYYVTLDRFAAVESAPSEWEAWNSYSYEGLYTVTPAIDRLTVTVKSKEAVGDIIGFRVFAVNYDGSLADPDGIAFYAQVGDPIEASSTTINAAITANKVIASATAHPAIAAIVNDLKPATLTKTLNVGISPVTIPAEFKKVNVTNPAFNGTFTIKADAEANENKVVNDVKGKYYLLKDQDGTAATSWSDINYIAVTVNNVEDIVDGATVLTDVTLQGEDLDHHNRVVNKLAITVTKNMPTGPTNFSWKSGADINSGILTLYMTPSATQTGASNNFAAYALYGWTSMEALCNNVDDNYVFYFKDADATKSAGYDAKVKTAVTVQRVGAGNFDADDYVITLPAQHNVTYLKYGTADAINSYINGSKTSDLTVKYQYTEKISRKYTDGAFQANTAPLVTVNQSEVSKVKFSYEIADDTYRWAKYNYVASWTPADITAKYTLAASDKYVVGFNDAVCAIGNKNIDSYQDYYGTGAAGDWYAYQYVSADALFGGVLSAYVAGLTIDWTAGSNSGLETASIDLTKLVICENEKFDAKAAFDGGILLDLASTDCTVTSSNGVAEYMNATVTAAGVVTFAAKAVDAPIRNISSTLNLNAYDAFGQKVEIKLPITVIPTTSLKH